MEIVVAFIFYVIPALFIIWFMVSIVSAQRERNTILREIVEKLEAKNNDTK
ncbi:hypothetical protein SAMN05880501_104183 [Ureibacillus xyleni]|uniref:Uncharacterized protein n=1 Tax=Ureibacillus xyleni TaxID=614648 RepID=A0A285SES8_9BACL|nr:hypothetical protein [Ureibacillus xyleni]SOC06083.1 hypothetical protein SAMN05880501_104183 [Ureibacillus xyleni]